MSDSTDDIEGARGARVGTLWRGALAIYVICLVGLIVAYLMVASMQVRTSVYMLGQTPWMAGQPNALRGTIMDPLSGRRWHDARGIELRLLTKQEAASAELASEQPAGLLLGRPSMGAAGILQVDVTPEVAPGDYVLSLRALAGPDHDLYEARSPVRVVEASSAGPQDAWQPQTTRREESALSERLGLLESKGPVRIDLLGREPELARGLPGEVHLLVTDRATGEPLACEVVFDEVTGMSEGAPPPARVTTSALGLARVRFIPTLAHTWELSTTCTPPSLPPVQAVPEGEPVPEVKSTSKVHIATVASQASVRVLDGPIVRGTVIEGGIESLRKNDGFYVDAFFEDRWASADIFGLGSGRAGWSVGVEPAGERARIVRLQVSQDLFLVGRAWDVTHVVQPSAALSSAAPERVQDEAWGLLRGRFAASEEDKERARFWSWLASAQGGARWAEAGPKTRVSTLAALLSAIPSHYEAPEALVNSQRDDEEAMARWREDVRSELLVVIGLAMLVGFVVLGVFVVQGLGAARARQAMLEELDLELESDGEGAADLGRTAQLVSTVQIVVVFGTIVVFGLSLMMLLRFL